MITGKNISVVIPVIRPDKALVAVESVKQHLKGAEIVTEEDTERIGCPRMVKRLVDKTTREWVLFLGDDARLKAGFLLGVQEAVNLLPDAWGVIGVNTQGNNDHAHWIAHKAMLDILPDREFFNTAYEHCFCDDELKDIALENGRWIYAVNAYVDHGHPVVTKVHDDSYDEAYGGGKFQRDQKTYWKRKRARLNKFAIGFPLVDQHIPAQFFLSYACMDKPSKYTLLVPDLPHGPWATNLADARNSIVFQALRDGVSRLFMIDTDQVYPSDTLTKLMAHDADVCGALVHKRWMPFDPVMLRGEIGRYKSLSDEEMFNNEVNEVDATGTGALLFNMNVFDLVPYPWFKFTVGPTGRPVGEDIYFCSRARRAGARICVDTSVRVGHLATIEINETFYKIFKKLMEVKKDGS
jgi:hypothetical protein